MEKLIINPQWLIYARKCNKYTQQEVSKALHRDIKTSSTTSRPKFCLAKVKKK